MVNNIQELNLKKYYKYIYKRINYFYLLTLFFILIIEFNSFFGDLYLLNPDYLNYKELFQGRFISFYLKNKDILFGLINQVFGFFLTRSDFGYFLFRLIVGIIVPTILVINIKVLSKLDKSFYIENNLNINLYKSLLILPFILIANAVWIRSILAGVIFQYGYLKFIEKKCNFQNTVVIFISFGSIIISYFIHRGSTLAILPIYLYSYLQNKFKFTLKIKLLKYPIIDFLFSIIFTMIMLIIFLNLNSQRLTWYLYELSLYRTIGYSVLIGLIPAIYNILKQNNYTSISILYYSSLKYISFFILSYLLIYIFYDGLIEGSSNGMIRLVAQFGFFMVPYNFFTNRSKLFNLILLSSLIIITVFLLYSILSALLGINPISE